MTCHFCGRASPKDPIPPGSLTVDGVAVEACRSCWEDHDDEDQLRTLEAARAEVFAPEELEGGRAPEYLKRIPDRIGKTFGRWTIVGVTHRPGVRGKPLRCWIARCSCGTERFVPTCDFGKAGLRDGEKCGACTRREREQAKAKRYGGKLVSELAREAGVSENAIRWRIRRLGWRPDQLGLPRGARRAPEGSPSARRAA